MRKKWQAWMSRSIKLVALVGGMAQGGAIACSLPEASGENSAAPVRYDFLAAVVDEDIADDPRNPGKKLVAALRLRVVEATGKEPAVGSIVAMGYRYTGSFSSTCKRETQNLTLRDWSAGTRVRIGSNDLYSAESMAAVD